MSIHEDVNPYDESDPGLQRAWQQGWMTCVREKSLLGNLHDRDSARAWLNGYFTAKRMAESSGIRTAMWGIVEYALLGSYYLAVTFVWGFVLILWAEIIFTVVGGLIGTAILVLLIAPTMLLALWGIDILVDWLSWIIESFGDSHKKG